jgi:AraC-like DNA-binding protein
MDGIKSISIEELIKKIEAHHWTIDDDLLLFSGRILDIPNLGMPARIDACVCLLCKAGEITLSIDYTEYRLEKKDMMFLINNLHIIENVRVNDYFEGYLIASSPEKLQSIVENIEEMKELSVSKLFPRIIDRLDETEIQTLIIGIERIIKIADNTSHRFRRNIIHNEFSNLLFEILNIKFLKDEIQALETTRNEEVVSKFIHLIVFNCRKQHKVSFYADELCMTAGNLTRIVKAASGKPAIKWINDALVTEARILLRKPNIMIQEVADALHFAEQSTFGKFFKKHTGLTPREYRKSIQK